jgi:hypothetical protein
MHLAFEMVAFSVYTLLCVDNRTAVTIAANIRSGVQYAIKGLTSARLDVALVHASQHATIDWGCKLMCESKLRCTHRASPSRVSSRSSPI